MLADDARDTLGGQFGDRVDRHPTPATGLLAQLDRLFSVVVDNDAVHIDLRSLDDVDGPLGAGQLVEVRQVHDHHHVAFPRHLQLTHEGAFLVGRDVVEANLSQSHTTRMIEVLTESDAAGTAG